MAIKQRCTYYILALLMSVSVAGQEARVDLASKIHSLHTGQITINPRVEVVTAYHIDQYRIKYQMLPYVDTPWIIEEWYRDYDFDSFSGYTITYNPGDDHSRKALRVIVQYRNVTDKRWRTVSNNTVHYFSDAL